MHKVKIDFDHKLINLNKEINLGIKSLESSLLDLSQIESVMNEMWNLCHSNNTINTKVVNNYLNHKQQIDKIKSLENELKQYNKLNINKIQKDQMNQKSVKKHNLTSKFINNESSINSKYDYSRLITNVNIGSQKNYEYNEKVNNNLQIDSVTKSDEKSIKLKTYSKFTNQEINNNNNNTFLMNETDNKSVDINEIDVNHQEENDNENDRLSHHSKITNLSVIDDEPEIKLSINKHNKRRISDFIKNNIDFKMANVEYNIRTSGSDIDIKKIDDSPFILLKDNNEASKLQKLEDEKEKFSKVLKEESVEINKKQTVSMNNKSKFASRKLMKTSASNNLLKDMDTKTYQKLMNQLEKYPQGAIIIDDFNKVVMCNSQILSKLFYHKDQFIDSNFTFQIDINDRDELVAMIENIRFRSQFEEKEGDKQATSIQDANEGKVNFIITFFNNNLKDKSAMNDINSSVVNNANLLTLILTPMKLTDELDIQMIDHRGNVQMIWNLLILSILTFLLWYIPQNVAFSSSVSNNIFDNVVMVIFLIDILINFNLTVEDEAEKTIFDHHFIILNYLKGWFIFDVVATFPMDLLFSQFIFNTQIFKSIKLVRMVRFIKLLRLTKLQQIQDFIMKSEEFYNFFKKNQGYLDLFKNMMQIQIFAHYYTVIFYMFETSYGDRTWLGNEGSVNSDEQGINIQNIILLESVRTALGLGVMKYQNIQEIWFQMVWMCIGLSLFGQGIGNISSQLNQANQEDIEYSKAIEFFTELCSMNKMDPRLYSYITIEVNDQFKNWQTIELNKQGSMLSNKLLSQIELELCKGFQQECKLFQNLGLKSLRIIKKNLKQGDNSLIMRKDSFMNHVYIILNGQINIQNDNMNFINEQKQGEILGMRCFYLLMQHKYDINIDQIMDEDEDGEKFNYKKLFTSVKSNTDVFSKENKKAPNSNNQLKKDVAQIKYNQYALGSKEVKQIMIPFETIDNIFVEDYDSFKEIQLYHKTQNEFITDDDIEKSEDSEALFNNNPLKGFMISDKGEFMNFNDEFENSFTSHQQLIGTHVLEVLKQIDDDGLCYSLNKIDNIIDGQQILTVNEEEYKIKLVFDLSFDLQRNHDSQIEQYKYKKSMNKVGIFQLEIC